MNLVQAWTDPNTRHAILVHVPIALGALGVVPVLWLAAGSFRSVELKRLVVAWFLAGAASAWIAARAGEAALERLRDTASLTDSEAAALRVHERRGGIAWVWPLIPAGLAAGTLARRRDVQVGCGVLAVLAAGGVSAWYGVIAHTGGGLVYAHGLGVPARASAPGVVEAGLDNGR